MNKPWVKQIRRESGLIENICKCGVGHPSAGSINWMKINGIKYMGVHGCCGCCQNKEWQLADLQNGLEIANLLLFDALKALRRAEKKK